ncbi:UNVERIFIED_CONTAM: hypothetical protein Sindi_2572900 [Sesamum indicum]
MGVLMEEQRGIPLTEGGMVDELPLNCRTPAILEYDCTTNPQEHLLLHYYTDRIKCRVFITTFATVSHRKYWKTKLSLFGIHLKQGESLKDHLHRFNTAALEVPSATQEVRARPSPMDYWREISSRFWLRNLH